MSRLAETGILMRKNEGFIFELWTALTTKPSQVFRGKVSLGKSHAPSSCQSSFCVFWPSTTSVPQAPLLESLKEADRDMEEKKKQDLEIMQWMVGAHLVRYESELNTCRASPSPALTRWHQTSDPFGHWQEIPEAQRDGKDWITLLQSTTN